MALDETTFDDVAIETMIADPYPVFDRIRAAGSAVYLPCANVHLVTRFADIHTVERHPEIFASTNPASLMNKVMGHSLMRKDFEEHARERKAIAPVFSPANVKRHMVSEFLSLTDALIDAIEKDGQADLFGAISEPLASKALAFMLGFDQSVWRDMAGWSQALMDGVGNYHGDPEIERRATEASAAIDRAIDDVLEGHRATPNGSIISAMVTAEDPHTYDQLRANVKVIIGGGLNEPRDSLLTMLLGLLSDPAQREAALADPKAMRAAFEESVRWVAPIGMYPRRVTCDTVLGDTELKEGTQIGVCVGAANRDPAQFENPHAFDIHRTQARHLAFGAGPHFCAGAWVARQMIGDIAVPRLFERLNGLRLDPNRPVVERGWVFRGPSSLPVVWDV